MNHPIHPEEQIFGGMVMGRDVPEPVPARTLAIVDAHHAKLNEALDAKDAEIARLTAAGIEAAQPQGDPVAWAVYAEVGGEMLAQYPPSFTLESAKDHQRMYGEGVNTEIRRLYTRPSVPVPVTDAEILAAGSALSNCAYNLAQRPGSMLSHELCASLDESRKRWDAAVTAARLASRGQA